MTVACLGYFPNFSIEEAERLTTDNTSPEIREILENKLREFSGITGTLYYTKDQDMYFLCKTDTPALGMNEYLRFYVNNEYAKDIEKKIIMICKLRADGGYNLGVLINPMIPLKRVGLRPPEEPEDEFEQPMHDDIVLVHYVPVMPSGKFIGSRLDDIKKIMDQGFPLNLHFLWHDLLGTKITNERIDVDIELLGPTIKADFYFSNEIEKSWQDVVTQCAESYLDDEYKGKIKLAITTDVLKE